MLSLLLPLKWFVAILVIIIIIITITIIPRCGTVCIVNLPVLQLHRYPVCIAKV